MLTVKDYKPPLQTFKIAEIFSIVNGKLRDVSLSLIHVLRSHSRRTIRLFTSVGSFTSLPGQLILYTNPDRLHISQRKVLFRN